MKKIIVLIAAIAFVASANLGMCEEKAKDAHKCSEACKEKCKTEHKCTDACKEKCAAAHKDDKKK